MKGRILDYDDSIWMNMEDYLNIMLDKLDALGMELHVYLDDFTPEQYLSNSYFIKGFTAATQMLAKDLASLTDNENRSRFFLALADQMNKIQEAQ